MTIIILLFRIWRCTDYNNIPKIANPDLPRSQVKYEYLYFLSQGQSTDPNVRRAFNAF